MIQILLKNGYPLPFIFSVIQMSIKFYFYKIKSTKIRTKVSNKYLTVSFIRTSEFVRISESFSNITRSINLKPAFTILNSLKKYITTGKDILETALHDVVYRISCNDYDDHWPNKKIIENKMQSIRRILIKKSDSPSIISNHRISLDHNFDWNKIKILGNLTTKD